MQEQLLPLDLPPGIYTNNTVYSAKGRWGAGNLVRFFEGTIRPIGGWRRLKDASNANLTILDGTPRAAASWRTSAGAAIVGVATTSKLFLIAAGVLKDITPAGFTIGNVDSGAASSVGAYGKGGYGVANYGIGSSIVGFTPATTWQLDLFGEFLAAVDTTNQALYIWQGDPTVAAAVATDSPSCVGVVVTAERFLVALGAGGDARTVQWASQETFTDWTPSGLNTAGSFPLTTNGALMAGRRIRGGTLLWTDLDVWEMVYLGDTTFIYSFRQVGDHCGLIAPNAVAVVDGRAMWMGTDSFYGYDGYVTPIPCDVSDSIFANLNFSQRAKIFAVPFTEFGEIFFFYPSAMSTEIDSYVVYNFREQHWSLGTLSRTCGATDGPTDYPIMFDAGGLTYEHEVLYDHEGSQPYVESGPIELGNGDRVMKINRIVPDEKTLGDVTVRLYTSFFPTDTETDSGPYLMHAPTDVRVTARQVRVRFAEQVAGAWRVGKMRLGIIPSGRR